MVQPAESCKDKFPFMEYSPIKSFQNIMEKPQCCDYLQDYFRWIQHGLFVITFVINAFGFWVIRRRSPPNMRGFSRYLTIHQFFAANLDAHLTLLGCPSFLFPMLGVHLYGIYNYIKFNGFLQLCCFLFSAGGYMASVLLMLFARQQAVLPTKHIFHVPFLKQKTACIVIFVLILAITMPIAALLPWEQYPAKFSYQQYWPCLSDALWSDQTFILNHENESTMIYIINGLMVLFFIMASFFTFPTANMLIFRHKVMSNSRRRVQTKFFLSLLTQISLPMMISVGPIALFGFTGKNYFNRISFNNIIIHCTSVHGAISTITMVIIYKSYRIAFFDLIGYKMSNSIVPFILDKKTESHPQTNTAVIKF